MYVQASQTVSGTTGGFSFTQTPFSARAMVDGSGLGNDGGAIKNYYVSGSIYVPENTRNVKISPIAYDVNQIGTIVSYTLYGSRSNQQLTATISYEYPVRQYNHQTTHQISSSVLDSEISISVSNGSYTKTRSGDTLTINWIGTSNSYKLTLSYPGPKTWRPIGSIGQPCGIRTISPKRDYIDY